MKSLRTRLEEVISLWPLGHFMLLGPFDTDPQQRHFITSITPGYNGTAYVLALRYALMGAGGFKVGPVGVSYRQDRVMFSVE